MLTLVIVVIAAAAGWQLWNYYLEAPWTRDGRVRANVVTVAPDVAGLIDDPYRSLAGALRRAGGYAKDTEPFSEFLWADFLRRRIKRKQAQAHAAAALEEALRLARSKDAAYLPGWCGPVSAG